jgi:hypothetical protein
LVRQMTAPHPAPRSGLTPANAVAMLASLHFDDVFNPYSDLCVAYDLPDAPSIRRANLLKTFEVASNGVDEVWLGLEPGHRGARRTGLAMTDDRHLAAHARRWGLKGIRRATYGGPETEQTAGIVWEALALTKRRVLLWNVFPLHCHATGTPHSNRRHTHREWLGCRDLLMAIVAMTSPRRIIAIGREARDAVRSVELDCVAVRHPAYGGKAEFITGVATR